MYTLSIILNFHREGELAEKTIHNLQKMVEANKQTMATWKEVEILAILDNADEKTKAIVYKYKELFSTIDEVDFKDLAHSRNYGVNKAEKNFVLFADGDDYCSLNVLEALYKTFYHHYHPIAVTPNELEQLSDDQHCVAVPNYLIEFPKLFQMEYCDSNDFIAQNNKFVHCFTSKIAAPKSLLAKYKVYENEAPYGYEDWDLNNRLLANGIHYKISNYKLYYRRENSQSLLAAQAKNKHIVRNSLLYDYVMINNKLQKIEEQPIQEIVMLQPERGVIWRTLSRSHTLTKVYRRVRYGANYSAQVPPPGNESIFKEDRLFLENYGESVSLREDIQFGSTKYFASHFSTQTKIYNQIMEFLRNKEVVYFFPWIILGGADKVSVAYTKALSDKNSCVITSICGGARIEDVKVPHLDLISGLEGWEHLSQEDQLHILVKAVINSGIKLIHIVNSEIAIKSVKYYDKVYKEHHIKTIVTLFCPDYDWANDAYHGYPIMYPELFSNADLILSDNHHWYGFFKELNNNQDFRYNKLSSPTEKIDSTYTLKTKDTKKILWASRICNQKLFGVLEEIVNLLPEYTFVIYGSIPGEKNNQEILARLVEKENIEFREEYQHISELNLNEFDLYLFTSLFEGIPTIILDMAMSGIPIVSADVGGISEVLGADYPLLIQHTSIASEYVTKIEAFYSNKDAIISKMQTIRDTVQQEYNEERFKHAYNSCIEDLLYDRR